MKREINSFENTDFGPKKHSNSKSGYEVNNDQLIWMYIIVRRNIHTSRTKQYKKILYKLTQYFGRRPFIK